MEYMSVKTFRELGYVHEINRMFLHPVGLALEVSIDDEEGNYFLSGIQDYRDDPEGMCYDVSTLSKTKADTVANIAHSRHKDRVNSLGYWIQPV